MVRIHCGGTKTFLATLGKSWKGKKMLRRTENEAIRNGDNQ